MKNDVNKVTHSVSTTVQIDYLGKKNADCDLVHYG